MGGSSTGTITWPGSLRAKKQDVNGAKAVRQSQAGSAMQEQSVKNVMIGIQRNLYRHISLFIERKAKNFLLFYAGNF